MRTQPEHVINAVRWPSRGDEYRDSGEGGLYAYAVWESTRDSDACVVSEAPVLPQPDVFVGSDIDNVRRDDLWPVPPRRYPDDADDYSVEFRAVVFLGSCPHSLFSEDRVGYFTVTRDHLTDEFAAVMNTLDEVYGVRGRILTFLDT